MPFNKPWSGSAAFPAPHKGNWLTLVAVEVDPSSNRN